MVLEDNLQSEVARLIKAREAVLEVASSISTSISGYLGQLNVAISETERLIKTHKEDVPRLAMENDRVSREISAQRGILMELRSVHSQELGDRQEKLKQLDSSIEAKQDNEKRLDKQIDALNVELRVISENVSGLRGEESSLARHNRDLVAENKVLDAAKAKKAAELAGLGVEVGELQKTVTILSRDARTLEARTKK